MDMVLYDGVIEDAVAFAQRVGCLAIGDFHFPGEDIDELFALVGRELEVLLLGGMDVDDEGFHVATGLLLGQCVVLHVLAGFDSIVGEADAARALSSTADHRAQLVAVIEESTQTHTQGARNLDQRAQRGQELVVFNGLDLFDREAATFCNFLYREVLRLPKTFNLATYNRVMSGHKTEDFVDTLCFCGAKIRISTEIAILQRHFFNEVPEKGV